MRLSRCASKRYTKNCGFKKIFGAIPFPLIFNGQIVFPARISVYSVVLSSLVGAKIIGRFNVASGGTVKFFNIGQENGPVGDKRLILGFIASSTSNDFKICF